ncbi:MAG: phosphomannomutase/phosphoglucomutase [Kiritimatiellae bacterium]|nr:phosphomannomutase/phosphoglucomutase [Kiritimatiellia bacterium]
MSGIFKAYDIRGIYGDDLTEAIAYDIGKAYITFTQAKKVVIGRDCRPHSIPLQAALTRGITEMGADVVDIGECSTPMNYYANGTLKAEGSIMITASHNPAEWNGFKLCRAEAVPISGVTGIEEIEQIVKAQAFKPVAETAGTVSTYDILPEYRAHIRPFMNFARRPKLAIDYANGMGIPEAKTFEDEIDQTRLFGDIDGSFPNHEANPLHHATLADLQKTVREGQYDFGVAFDGDADRAGFIDEKGEIIPMDLITALIAQDVLSREKGVIFYDLRSSRVVKEVIEAAGGIPMMSRVGHAFIKAQMREHKAIFAGELSGHYYFRDNFVAESSSMAVIALCNIVTNSDKPLSELIAPLRKYACSGEINTKVARDPLEILAEIKEKYADGNVFELDGVSVEYPTWWFNVRCSNTEPLVRLNLESTKSTEEMEAKRDEVLALIRK